jgi:hypothetical protein
MVNIAETGGVSPVPAPILRVVVIWARLRASEIFGCGSDWWTGLGEDVMLRQRFYAVPLQLQ